jgi:predicted DNA-binding transcriptional regulator YafY
MPARDTAAERLNRILYVLPAASRKGGVALRELANALGVDPKRVGRDVTEAGERGYYHPAGEAPDANLQLDGERVILDPPCSFRRPARLTAREAAALNVGIRSLAIESSAARRDKLLSLADALEKHLALPVAQTEEVSTLAVYGDTPAGDVYDVLRTAARERRRCRVRYLKAGQQESELRTVDPYALLFAERWWYVVGHCHARADVRLFRVDRILAAECTQERFDMPGDFDAGTHAPTGRAFVSTDTVRARVRYGPRIARWIQERHHGMEAAADGSVIVDHTVADPRWLVRHVLQYGSDAEVLEPVEFRRLVRQVVERFGRQGSPGQGQPVGVSSSELPPD